MLSYGRIYYDMSYAIRTVLLPTKISPKDELNSVQSVEFYKIFHRLATGARCLFSSVMSFFKFLTSVSSERMLFGLNHRYWQYLCEVCVAIIMEHIIHT